VTMCIMPHPVIVCMYQLTSLLGNYVHYLPHPDTVCMHELTSLLGDSVHYLPRPDTLCVYELTSLSGDYVHYLFRFLSAMTTTDPSSASDSTYVLLQSLPSPHRTAAG
jgi:hypothetical protein